MPVSAPPMSSTKSTLSMRQAFDDAPTLLRLGQMASESAARLDVIRPLLPPALRDVVQSGTPEPKAWALLVPHNSAAAKLRQLLPTLLCALQAADHPVQIIRVKVVQARR